MTTSLCSMYQVVYICLFIDWFFFSINCLVDTENSEQVFVSICSSLVITKMVEQVPISCLDWFLRLWVRLKAYGTEHQLGAASVQTRPCSQAITSWSLGKGVAYAPWRVTCYFSTLFCCCCLFLTFTKVFFLLFIFSNTFFFISFSHSLCSAIYWFVAFWVTS